MNICNETKSYRLNFLLSNVYSYFRSIALNPANTLRKSSVILRLYFGNLGKRLSANVDVT